MNTIAIGNLEAGVKLLGDVPEGVRYVDMTPEQRCSAFWANENLRVAMLTGRQSHFSRRMGDKYEREMLFILRCARSRKDSWAIKLKAFD